MAIHHAGMLVMRFVALVFAVSASPAAAQGFPPQRLANLQVLPADTRPGDLIGTMKAFTVALGVRCQHCHVGEEGMPLETFDFPADTRTPKTTARAMMRMVQQLNATVAAAVPSTAAEPRVTCWTCHRGKTTPEHSP